MILYILSKIWKNGGVIERLDNGELQLTNHEKIPDQTIKAAEVLFNEIDSYLKTVEGMSKVDSTVWKMMIAIMGWKENKIIIDFLNDDEKSLDLIYQYQTELNKNGWGHIYDDWLSFENENTEKIKRELYERCINYFKAPRINYKAD